MNNKYKEAMNCVHHSDELSQRLMDTENMGKKRFSIHSIWQLVTNDEEQSLFDFLWSLVSLLQYVVLCSYDFIYSFDLNIFDLNLFLFLFTQISIGKRLFFKNIFKKFYVRLNHSLKGSDLVDHYLSITNFSFSYPCRNTKRA